MFSESTDAIAREAGKTLLFNQKCEVVGQPIRIHDASGPLLFLDYVLISQSGLSGWVRVMPDAVGQPAGPVISATLGAHPLNDTRRQMRLRKILERTGSRIPTQQTLLGALVKMSLHSDKPVSDRAQSFQSRLLDASDSVSPTFVCYHYPEVGVLVERAGGVVGYVDVEDGSFFPLSEQGLSEQLTETRAPYSFFDQVQEMGDPGQFTVPVDEFNVPGVKLSPQIRGNYCAAASCQMILASYGIEADQEAIARVMGIPESGRGGGAGQTGQLLAYSRCSGGKLAPSWDNTPLGQECIDALATGKPVKNGIFQHAQVAVGWKNSLQGALYKIHDPLPVGEGSIKYQNPRVVWSNNIVTVTRVTP